MGTDVAARAANTDSVLPPTVHTHLVDLRARLTRRSDLARVEGLLDEWIGVRLSVPLTVLDDTGFPIAFAEFRDAVGDLRPVILRFDGFDIDVVDTVEDVAPGRHGWVRASASRGVWSRPLLGDGASHLVSVDIGSYLFGTFLDLISLTAPVRLELAMLDAVTLDAFISRLEPIDPDAGRSHGRAGLSWFAAESVLVGLSADRDRMWLFGQRTQDVDAVVPETLALCRHWHSTERMHGPATDDVSLRESNVRDDARPTRRDLREVFAIADPMTALVAFLESWSGETLPEVTGVSPDVPPLLARVDACPRAQELFGGIDHFDGLRSDITEDGFERFWEQHQGVAFIGYQPGEPDPEIFIMGSFDAHEPRWSMGLRMSRFLYRTAVSVAADRAPCTAHTRATHDDVQRIQDTYPVVLPNEGTRSPFFLGFGELRSDGQILVACGANDYEGWITVSAPSPRRDRQPRLLSRGRMDVVSQPAVTAATRLKPQRRGQATPTQTPHRPPPNKVADTARNRSTPRPRSSTR